MYNGLKANVLIREQIQLHDLMVISLAGVALFTAHDLGKCLERGMQRPDVIFHSVSVASLTLIWFMIRVLPL
jgi:hypothetical protein